MSAPRVFVTRRIPDAGLDLVRERCTADVWEGDLPPRPDELRRRAEGCAGVLALLTDRFPAGLLDALPELRVISNFAVGVNNIDLDAARARGIRVGNTPGVLTDATADLTVALLLAAARRIVPAVENARSGAWRTWEPRGFLGKDLARGTLGIVGMGRIGAAVARRMHGGFGMRVVYTSRSAKPDLDEELDARRVDLDELLATSDVVSLHCDLNADTVRLLDGDALRRMRPDAILVNTARGGLVAQDDLLDVLRSGHLFAVALDVTDPEPPRHDDPLLTLPNVVVTPHIGSATRDTRDAMARIAAQNLIAGVTGAELPHPVV